MDMVRRTQIAVGDVLAAVSSWLRLDARAWGVSDRAAIAWLAAPVGAADSLAASYLVKPVFRFLTDEDSVIEWSQALALGAALIGASLVALAMYRRRALGLTLVFGTVAIASFLVLGEEISWGQRILGLVTPAGLEAINEQGETNIHNIDLFQPGFWTAELLVGLYGVAVPLLVADRSSCPVEPPSPSSRRSSWLPGSPFHSPTG